MATDNTIVIVLDEQHLAEFKQVLPNWLKWHPEILEDRWLLLCENEDIQNRSWDLLSNLLPADTHLDSSRWAHICLEGSSHSSPDYLAYSSQREQALWQYIAVAPWLIRTKCWTKIDTDVVAGPHETGDGWRHTLGNAVVTGSPWGYTKPAGAIGKLNVWSSDSDDVQYRACPDKDKCPRLISWFGMYDTAFTRKLAEQFVLLGWPTADGTPLPYRRCFAGICHGSRYRCRMQVALMSHHACPVISHDTLTWYYAQVTGQNWQPVTYDHFGWHHVRPRHIPSRIALEDTPGREFPIERHSRVVAELAKSIDAKLAAEIGVYRGTTSHALLALNPQLFLYMIDLWQAWDAESDYAKSGDSVARMNQAAQDSNLLAALSRNRLFKDRYEVHRVLSEHAARTLYDRVCEGPESLLDLVFIDAAHDYESVKKDLRVWWHTLRSGGIFCGHDYGHRRYPGVKQAVDEFCASHGQELVDVKETVWWLVKR